MKIANKSVPKVDLKKLTTFLGLVSSLTTENAPIQQSGQWLIVASPYKWGDTVNGSMSTAGDMVAEVKALGFKSAWIRGGRLGVNVKDVAQAA